MSNANVQDKTIEEVVDWFHNDSQPFFLPLPNLSFVKFLSKFLSKISTSDKILLMPL